MFIILGCLENFSMDWRTGSVWDFPEIRYGLWEIFKLFTTLLKNSWKVSSTFLSLEMIFSFSINVILSLHLILLGKMNATFFQNAFLFFYKFYNTVLKIRPFQFSKKTNTNVSLIIISCFSYFTSFFQVNLALLSS